MRIGRYAPAYLTSESASFSPDLPFMYKQSNHMCRQHWRQYGIASQWLGRWICSLKVQGSRWTTSCLGIAFHFTTLSLALFVQFSVFISHMIKTWSVHCEKSTLTLCTPLSNIFLKKLCHFQQRFCCNMKVFLRDCYCSRNSMPTCVMFRDFRDTKETRSWKESTHTRI